MHHDFLLASAAGKDEVKTEAPVRKLCKGCPEVNWRGQTHDDHLTGCRQQGKDGRYTSLLQEIYSLMVSD